jgi:hypothetical protein
MKKEKQLVNSQAISEINTEKHLHLMLVTTMDRVGDTELNVINTASDIFNKFGYDIHIRRAISDGSFGKYGVTFKLTTQVIGNWIYQSRKTQNN